MVGAGALGCELIKAFALMGIGCSKEGKVSCTDNDNIEVSNLNRQFLFRKNNVGQSKSLCACDILLDRSGKIDGNKNEGSGAYIRKIICGVSLSPPPRVQYNTLASTPNPSLITMFIRKKQNELVDNTDKATAGR